MRSTFHALETARRALFAQQAALQTTAHNIANASTPGYSRQRVSFQQTNPFPSPARNRPEIPGQIGTGVEAGAIQRIRNAFLDLQYRAENTKLGYWKARSDALARMETIFNEPSENGLSATLNRFWESLQDLAANPENSGARSVVRQRGIAVSKTFQYLANSLQSVQQNLRSEIDVTVDKINSLARQIHEINVQIANVEPHGYLANDLYDKRDVLVDELSELVHVDVSRVSSGGHAPAGAVGRYTVEIVTSNGERYMLVDGSALNFHTISVTEDGSGKVSVNEWSGSASGKLAGLLEAHNELYAGMLNDLNRMAYEFVRGFNNVHRQGYGLQNATGGRPFFEPLASSVDAAFNIQVSEAILNDAGQIAASSAPTLVNGEPAHRGNGDNALRLADVIMKGFDTDGDGTKDFILKDFYNGMIGSMAVSAQEANRMAENAEILVQSAEKRRESVSGVSLDEEMTHLIQYQHAYNAAARMVSVVDEMLNTIINRMGV